MLLLAAIGAAGVPVAGAARAQNYPWCSNFADGAGTNCGFTTEAQCRITVQGSGGYCDRNTQYTAPGVAAPARRNATDKAGRKTTHKTTHSGSRRAVFYSRS